MFRRLIVSFPRIAIWRVSANTRLANISNDGEYPWNAAVTFHNAKLKNGSDYSLMLWSDNPPRRSISGYFTLRTTPGGDKDSNTDVAVSAADLARQKKCLEYLASNRGSYNYSLDSDFRRGEYYMEFYKNSNTTWQIHNDGVGTTTLSFDGYNASGDKSAQHFSSASMDLVSHSTLGKGMFSLNMLQAARNAEVVEMNIVALNLGTEGHPGSVVLGGYDDALIDTKQRAVFPKGTDLPNAFHASMTKLSFVAGDSTTVILDERTNADSVADVGLAYDDYAIRLSQGIIDSLLPLIGNPEFDKGSNIYVYRDEPKTDYTLNFGLNNGSVEMTVKVPGSSLVVTESSNDNPLTSRNETGRTYLRITPTPDGSSKGQYLGRSFLQHIYIIDSPSVIGRFHLSALPSPLPDKKNLIAASPASITIFAGKFSSQSADSGSPRIGPMVGGIAGGILILGAGAYGCFFLARRRNRRRKNTRDMKGIDKYSGLDKEAGLGHIIHHHRGGDLPDVDVNSSVRTTATIPIRYSPSFVKEIGIGYRYSPSQGSRSVSHVQSQPVILFPSTSTSPASDRGEFNQGQDQGSVRREPRLSTTLSTVQRRNSEVSTVAREYGTASSEPEEGHAPAVPDESAPRLYRSATVGRMFPAGKVRSVDGPTPPLTPAVLFSGSRGRGPTPPHTPGVLPARGQSRSSGNIGKSSHTRTASLGRVVSPTEVDVGTISRRSSTRASGIPPPRAGSAGSSSSGNGSLGDLREENSPIAEHSHRFPLPPRPSEPKPQSTPEETDRDYLDDEHRRLAAQIARPPSAPSIISEQEVGYTHSRSGSSDEVFGLGAVVREEDGAYMKLKEGWLASGSESSGTGEEGEEQFLNSRAGSKSSWK